MEPSLQLTGRACLQGWNSLLVRPEPLLIKDIKVQANKQKPKIECPAQMKHNSDKMPNCSNVQPALQQTPCYAQAFYDDFLDDFNLSKSAKILFCSVNK
jgi:hypothetical protein